MAFFEIASKIDEVNERVVTLRFEDVYVRLADFLNETVNSQLTMSA